MQSTRRTNNERMMVLGKKRRACCQAPHAFGNINAPRLQEMPRNILKSRECSSCDPKIESRGSVTRCQRDTPSTMALAWCPEASDA
jgi:hypothetical protein